MKAKKFPLMPLLAGLALLAGPLLAAEGSVYAHISFVDNGATVLREDGSKDAAVVNLPLAPGDTVVTPGGGRCELQFDNGTVVRLDKGSRLRIATVLAPSLTSSWRITTLELERGQLYALPQSYSREMFQVVTPNAAVSLKSRVRAYVRLDAGGGSSFFSDGGKFRLLYGADSRHLKKATVKSERPLAIGVDNVPAAQVEKRDIEFMGWNEYVDNHFQALHRGISKLPPKLKFGNSALTYWAEKWSSLYGEWIYDELFGYVWRPADDLFAHSARPFFHASFLRIDGSLFLVPQEAWGWVPAHMGTWVWQKRGWTWIPGDWFHSGCVDYSGLYSLPIDAHFYGFPTFDYLWNRWRWQWHGAASRELHLRPGGELPVERPKKPVAAMLPEAMLRLLRKVEKAPAGIESKRLAIEKADRKIDAGQLPVAPALRAQPPATGSALPPAILPGDGRPGHAGSPAADKAATPRTGTALPDGLFSLKHDWNPDRLWAQRRGNSIRYSSNGNSVICPELNVSSSGYRRGQQPGPRDAAQPGGAAPAPAGPSTIPSGTTIDPGQRGDNSSQGNAGERVKKDGNK